MVTKEIAVKKYAVKLSVAERERLDSLIHTGKHPAQKLTCLRTFLSRLSQVNAICSGIDFGQLEQPIGHRRRSNGRPREPWHGGEIVSPVEAIFERGEVAWQVLRVDRAVGFDVFAQPGRRTDFPLRTA